MTMLKILKILTKCRSKNRHGNFIPAVKNLLDSEGLIPDGVTAFPYKQGKCLTWDFTCVNTISDSYLLECAKEAGKGAAAAEMKKDRKYERLLNNYCFVPIALETFGA